MKGQEPLPRFLTPEEVADLLRVSHRTVYNWLHSGQLPAIRVGKVGRVRHEDADPQWAQGGRFNRSRRALIRPGSMRGEVNRRPQN
jgi:excisionase family DNA binding protein